MRIRDWRSDVCSSVLSKGPFFLAADLPPPGDERDRVLLRVLGALEPRRIDGIGGPDPLVNKIAIISPSLRADTDVDYLFAQVCVHKNTVDRSEERRVGKESVRTCSTRWSPHP